MATHLSVCVTEAEIALVLVRIPILLVPSLPWAPQKPPLPHSRSMATEQRSLLERGTHPPQLSRRPLMLLVLLVWMWVWVWVIETAWQGPRSRGAGS